MKKTHKIIISLFLNIRLIAYTIYRLIDDMDQIYSKRMIDQANEEITRFLNVFSAEYNNLRSLVGEVK